MIRWIDVKPHNIAQLDHELRIIGQLELTYPMGLQAMGAPDALDRTHANPDRLGHGRARPMGRVQRRSSQGQGHDALGNLGIQGWDARWARLVAPQRREAFGSKPFLPAPNDGLGLTGLPHDLGRAMAIGSQQNDLGAPDMLLRTIPIGDDRPQRGAVSGIQCNLRSVVHPPDSHNRVRGGNPQKNRNVRFGPLAYWLLC